jgi:CRP/FNR family transcriptional regulator, cyclic AMP receptor protein
MMGSSVTSRGRPGPPGSSPRRRGAGDGHGVAPWPHAPGPWREPAGASSPTRYCYLFDKDADLADVFDPRMRLVVRQLATALMVEVPAGARMPDAERAGGLGFLILEGLFTVDVHVGGRAATELLGPGDLLQPLQAGLDDLFEREVVRRALTPSRAALLDHEFVERTRPWPEILLALLRRAERRAATLNLHRAVSSHPSLELRLALLLWQLAERWGRVEPGGVRLDLPLTHAVLGRLVAAERPSVSRSLARLAEQELVIGGAGEWHLLGSAETCSSALASRSAERMRRHEGADASLAPAGDQ